ncbi:hypothetical protein FNJ62_06670 [Streptomyces benahoarensis]|nr:hypothetical protein [Streptomyces benahoarensis]TSB31367.1 hypothetical protein FNJ62_06670 [Streptomyces benahoarensis]
MSEDREGGGGLTGPVLLGDAEVRESPDATCAVRAVRAVLAGSAPGRTDTDAITLFSSVGLAGTEVAVAAELAGRCRCLL